MRGRCGGRGARETVAGLRIYTLWGPLTAQKCVAYHILSFSTSLDASFWSSTVPGFRFESNFGSFRSRFCVFF